ncbi:hypothetical protein RWE15_01965 [Virgibacillus halophilus]|uniref:Uncharacterized protein n=1 Tax=Tigheibacillus halophilus TaxID=361280 RepID=A0ABU5C2M3_9BACI|nr:hypothetical protein [Virgibacillus halophilus]
MHIKIGVIGPSESVAKILKVSRDFEGVTFIPFVYDEVSQISTIIANNRLFVDQWLFSGIMNYSYAIDQQLIKKEDGSFPPLHGSSFFWKAVGSTTE